MRRDRWEFPYAASQVADAALARAEHHRQRIVFWRAETQAAAEALRAAGVEVVEQQVTGGSRSDVQFDQNLMSECRNKVAEHDRRMAEYEAFNLALNANPNAVLELDVDDVTFFGLGEGVDESRVQPSDDLAALVIETVDLGGTVRFTSMMTGVEIQRRDVPGEDAYIAHGADLRAAMEHYRALEAKRDR